jgi:SAM-dependent methyltransferase
VLERRVRSVLDVGCGEGRWRAPLRRARPGLSYLGVDGSDWVVRRYGKRRNIRPGTFATIGRLGLRRRFDLIVCSDVLHYLPTAELRRGLAALRRLSGGVLWLDALTSDDDFEGDREEWQPRRAATYRRLFAEAGLAPCGLNGWAPRARARTLAALERSR